MIFITGDTHIPVDIDKVFTSKILANKSLTKNDYLIICGDFGGVWDKQKLRNDYLDKLNNLNFTTLFIDGNHENFTMLNSFDVANWNDGNVHFIKNSVIHLMRGQIFTINNKTFFTMGGGNSIDKGYRIPDRSWWKQEMPSKAEYDEAINNLEKVSYKVDYIITHTAPLSIIRSFYEPQDELELNRFLELVKDRTTYEKWFFAHVHDDIIIDEKHTLLFNKIIKI